MTLLGMEGRCISVGLIVRNICLSLLRVCAFVWYCYVIRRSFEICDNAMMFFW